MEYNPFTNPPFTSIWIKYFASNLPVFNFPFFKGLSFVKHSWLPLYINVGKNQTKGITYQLNPNSSKFFKNHVFLIYDCSDYYNLVGDFSNRTIGRFQIEQYSGFIADLSGQETVQDYLKRELSKRGRQKIIRYEKRLNTCFRISFKMHQENIPLETYENLFQYFKSFLIKRFDEKQETNNNLDEKEWDFFKVLTFELLKDKQASLFVTYEDETPIAISLHYLRGKTIIDVIRSFDIDYSKFHLGSVSIAALIKWCYENSIDRIDFSKGDFEYKRSWANLEHHFENHIYYNKRSTTSSLLAMTISRYFKLKRFLRDFGLNQRFHKFTYSLNKRNSKIQEKILPSYMLIDTVPINSKSDMELLDMEKIKVYGLKKTLNDFLFLTSEHKTDAKVYKMKSEPYFFIEGLNSNKKVIPK